MHLKTLTLRGFKSFASATTMHFEPGVTCVVGPNGSGKSNVVDALAWVMGEQGAKTLRGAAMSDVIFAGTATRPALGRAEVSLTIDNTDGALPIDYSEVTISRTLFSAGGSEYAINGSPCRLLDIQDLLSDTGMGREMHVIVGQGQLDAVLRASPEERRGFIEEAAGVLKHRKRKEKALRKLEAMAANLARLSDLVAEIRRQLGPLAKQADVARRAQVIQADQRDARARLLADDLVQVSSALAQEIADEALVREARDAVEQAQQHARTALAEQEALAAAAAPALGEATEIWYRLSGLRERLRGSATLAAERCRLLGSPAPAHEGRDPDDLAAQAERARQAEVELRAEVDAARADLEASQERRRIAEAAAAAAERELQAVHRGVADRREGLATLAGKVGQARSRLEAHLAEASRLREVLAAATQRAEAARSEFAELERQASGVEEGEQGLDAAHEAATVAVEEAAATVDELVADERTAESDGARWSARRDALALSLARTDGTGSLLAGPDRPAGVLGALADLTTVEPGWESAIAAALGPVAEAAAVESVGAAVDAMRRLREREEGGAHLLVADADAVPASSAQRSDDPPDGARWARPLVQAGPAITPALDVLLARVVVTPDLAAARDVVEAADLIAVTSDGDVLSRTFAQGGGHSGPSLLELHAAHEEAENELALAASRRDQARFALGQARERLDRARIDQAATLDALHDSDARIAAVAERLGQLGAALRAAESEAKRTEPAIEQSDHARAEHEMALAELAERLDAARHEPEDAVADVEQATLTRDTAEAGAREERAAEMDARLVLRTLEERARALSGRAESLERAAAQERSARARAAERERQRISQARVAAEVRATATRALAILERSLAAASAERDRAEAERSERDARLSAIRAELDELSARYGELTDDVHRDEVARAEQRLRVAQLEERSLADLGLEPTELLEQFGPDQMVPQPPGPDGEPVEPRSYVRAEQEKRLRAAERGLALLGRVNPLALEEHAALEERHQFLAEQLADLKRSRADLMEIIREIDERVEQVFTQAYADTAREFEGVFSRLFPGGEGKLLLTDPHDMLTTGIEVEARPPGKKVKRLSLLSGGERSLTAVALLVAIFKARPSPFYVMDEVEAALDDVNLGRLLEIFTELREDSQLIVITHQKRTMEIADALYGVTMRGDGVTTVISQRLHDSGVTDS